MRANTLMLSMLLLPLPVLAGQGELSMALKGHALVSHLTLPAADVVGFTHAPANADEKMAVTNALARLGEARNVLEPLAEAACEVTREGVESGLAPALKQGAPGASLAPGTARFEARYAWHCAHPEALLAVDVPLLEFLNGVALDTLVITDQGTRAMLLEPPQTRLPIQRP